MVPGVLNYSYNAYYFPFLVLFSVLVATTIVLISAISYGRRHQTFYEILIVGALKLFYAQDVERKGPGKILMHDRILGPKGLVLQFSTSVIVLCCATVAFWSEFLIKEKNECDEQFDCFAFNVSDAPLDSYDSEPVTNMPLGENCTEYENEDFTIFCYKFSLDYANALANAGGVLVVSRTIASLHITLWILLSSLITKEQMNYILRCKKNPSESNGRKSCYSRCNHCCFLVTFILDFTILAVLILLIPILGLSVPTIRDQLFDQVSRFLHFSVYYVTLVMVILASGPAFLLGTKPDNDATTELVQVN